MMAALKPLLLVLLASASTANDLSAKGLARPRSGFSQGRRAVPSSRALRDFTRDLRGGQHNEQHAGNQYHHTAEGHYHEEDQNYHREEASNGEAMHNEPQQSYDNEGDSASRSLRGGKNVSGGFQANLKAKADFAKTKAMALGYFLGRTLMDSVVATLPVFGSIYAINMQKTLKSELDLAETKGDAVLRVASALLSAVPYSFALAPLENIKKEMPKTGGDAIQSTKLILKRDGPLGFLRGVWLHAAKSAGELGVMQLVDLLVTQQMMPNAKTDEEKAQVKLMASLLAAYASITLATPLANVGARLSTVEKPITEQTGCGAVDGVAAFKDLYATEGYGGLYKGAGKSFLAKTKALLWAHLFSKKVMNTLTATKPAEKRA